MVKSFGVSKITVKYIVIKRYDLHNMITLQESAKPPKDLRNHCSDISKQFREQLLEILAEAEDDVKNERTAPVSETFHNLRVMLQEK